MLIVIYVYNDTVLKCGISLTVFLQIINAISSTQKALHCAMLFVTEHVFESLIWGSLVIKSSILRNLYQSTQVYLYIMYCTSIISS